MGPHITAKDFLFVFVAAPFFCLHCRLAHFFSLLTTPRGQTGVKSSRFEGRDLTWHTTEEDGFRNSLGAAPRSTSAGFKTRTARPFHLNFVYAGLWMDRVKHTGGCHCGAVRFEVWSSPDLHVFHCNCSICTKKQNHHFIVPKNHFTLLQGSDNLTTYTFNTHAAKHTFCKTCGVQSFYTPRSNPDGYGVAPHCLDPGTVRSVTVEQFCGEKWEDSMKAHKSIRDMSKPDEDQ